MKDFYTIAEIAELLNATPRSIYMHFYRGHLVAYRSKSHKLFFTKVEVLRFISEYYPTTTILG